MVDGIGITPILCIAIIKIQYSHLRRKNNRTVSPFFNPRDVKKFAAAFDMRDRSEKVNLIFVSESSTHKIANLSGVSRAISSITSYAKLKCSGTIGRAFAI